MNDLYLRVLSVVGVAIFLGLAYITSWDRKKVNYKRLVRLLIIQVILGALMLKTTAGIWIIGNVATGFLKLLDFAKEGIGFVFGGVMQMDNPPFLIMVLMPIVFISALIGILQYTKVLPFVIKYIGLGLGKVTGMGHLESYNAAASIFVGQSEVFISLKNQVPKLSKERLFTLAMSAMSSVSMSIAGAYMQMLDPKYIVTAIVLNILGAFIVVTVMNPYEVTAEENAINVTMDEEANDEGQSLFEVIGEYILDGWNVAIIVGAMLIGFVGLIAMISGIFELVGLSFEQIIGFIFAPFAFLTGIELNESIQAGSFMATKLVSNEFVAMLQLEGAIKENILSERTIAIVSVFLVSFANFSSIGMIAGTVSGINKVKGNTVAKFGLKLLWGSTLVSFINAAIVGIVL